MLSDSRFENLVDAHGRQVLNLALRILGDADLARDVHQEVFLAIWRRWHTYNGDTRWGAYLYRVTVRKAMELARSRKAASVPADRAGPACTTAGPDMALRTEELHEQLQAALARLPERQAEVFVLSRVEGLDHAAIAAILGCSPNTVRVHLHRAVKQLAREMSDYLQ